MNEVLANILKQVKQGHMTTVVARMSAGVVYGGGNCTVVELTKFDKTLRLYGNKA